MWWSAVYLPEAERERSTLPEAERAAMIHVDNKLQALGPALGYPHSSAVRGVSGLRELRPRGGRSPWRGLYRQGGDTFVVAAVGPEAQANPARVSPGVSPGSAPAGNYQGRVRLVVKLSELRSAQEIAAEELRDPRVREEYERKAFANAVAIRVIQYRAEHGLSQSALARRLGMRQPAIARLETGEHEPSLAMLARLARGLGIDLSIDITPSSLGLRDTA